ncbi:MAG: cytochrome o ubiquinol oxidase subunit III, partial [Gammaproteobacteria bacterium]|nr:cytochrome o ubiquinol oxidase subunit III [Gammaproteobacteria bacterium]
ILVMIFQLPLLKITAVTKRRMTYLGLFWNFLDIVWIFVFTIVYLMGAM